MWSSCIVQPICENGDEQEIENENERERENLRRCGVCSEYLSTEDLQARWYRHAAFKGHPIMSRRPENSANAHAEGGKSGMLERRTLLYISFC